MASADSYAVEIKTVQTPSIKTVFESLKDILIDANLRFSSDGIKIIEANPTRTLFVHMSLNKSFEVLNCKKNKIVGINLTNLYKPMKTMNNSDVLTIKIKDDPSSKKTDVITLMIENSEKGKSLSCDIKLMDINITNIGLKDLDYESAVTMPSEELQNICKAMLSFDIEVVDIQNIGQFLSFSGSSDTGNYNYKFTSDVDKDDADIVIKPKSKKIVQGFFSLKYLAQFTKCTSLSSHVTLFLGNNMPITVQYDVGSMGVLKFVLAPKAEDKPKTSA